MKGFKDSTKTQYTCGGPVGYARGGSVKGAAKVSKVMSEFKRGDLHSGSKDGPKVTNPKQAVAIALSEAGKEPVKKSLGGFIKKAAPVLLGGALGAAVDGGDAAGGILGGVAGLALQQALKKKRRDEAVSVAQGALPQAAPAPGYRRGGKVGNGRAFNAKPMYGK